MVEQHVEQLTPSEAFFKHFQQEAIGILSDRVLPSKIVLT